MAKKQQRWDLKLSFNSTLLSLKLHVLKNLSNPWGKYIKIIPYLKGIIWCMALWRAWHIWFLWSVGINHTNSFIAHDTCQEFNWYAWSLTWTWNFPVKLSQESVSTHHWNDHRKIFPYIKISCICSYVL